LLRKIKGSFVTIEGHEPSDRKPYLKCHSYSTAVPFKVNMRKDREANRATATAHVCGYFNEHPAWIRLCRGGSSAKRPYVLLSNQVGDDAHNQALSCTTQEP
jgi:hypothetical protein